MAKQASNISLPKGGGAVSGLGETFSPDLFTGTGNFSVPIEVPPGRNGFQPQLSLVYSTGNGISPFGLGWNLSIPGVSRKTSRGIPRYVGEDTFILSGAEDLVPVQKKYGVTQYQPRTEGLFAKIDRYLDDKNDYWQVRSKEGLTSYYGNEGSKKKDSAVITDPANRDNVFSWKLTKTQDTFGNQILYTYLRDSDDNYDQLYLHEIRYLNYGDSNNKNPDFLLTIRFNYDDLPKQQNIYPSSDHRAGFEIRTAKRCRSIEIYSNPDALPQHKLTANQLTRSFHFKYIDQLRPEKLQELNLKPPQNGLSYLHQIEVVGHDNGKTQTLPAPRFSYSTFDPQQRKFTSLAGKNLPTQSLADPNLELVDLFGNGLPDLLETKGAIRYWRNLGSGKFDMPRLMKEAPTALSLSTAGVQLLDATGDGRPDLLVSNSQLNGYFSSEAGALWDRRSFQRYRKAPSVSLQDPQVKLIDLDGDGVTDALRSGSRFELFYNDPEQGWSETQQVSRKDLENFPNVNFTDQRLKWADMSGDNLTDIVLVHDGNVEYWPYQGYGKWGKRVHMQNSPRFPYGYDPQRIYLGDIDGSGNADLIYIDHRKVILWLNQAGKGWSDPIEIDGTPAVTNPASVRLVDLYGSGVSGLLWTDDKRGSRDHYYFLDFTGGIKPYLLTEMDNRLGALTRVHYESSIRFYLQDEKRAKTRWQSTLPFPVQVVSRVESIDQISKGKLTTEYSYHHGYWDGEEREFRGFGRVDQRDTESFENYHQQSTDKSLNFEGVNAEYFSPPTETRTWFHQGPVRKKDGHWTTSDYRHEYWLGDPVQLNQLHDLNSFLKTLNLQERRDALRTLRGTMLRSETYALDGSPRELLPYTVSESASEVREESPPLDSTDKHKKKRQHIFFPFSVVSRTTQWERGDKPMSQFSFTSDYDEYGQPQKSWQIACPKKWKDILSSTQHYLATYSETDFAKSDDINKLYIVDRPASAKSYELKTRSPLTILQFKQQLENNQIEKHLIGHTLNFYDGKDYTGLALNKIGEHGILSRTESLVLTEDILNQIHDSQLPAYFDQNGQPNWSNEYPQAFIDKLPIKNTNDSTRPDLSITPLGYGFADADRQYSRGYYAVGERQSVNDRGMVETSIDPYGNTSTITYDQYDFLPVKAINPIGLEVNAEYNYRTLQVAKMTDANGNQSSATYSPLGLIQSTQINGKEGEKVGDRPDQPSTRYEYDFNAFINSQKAGENPQPVYIHTIQRTEHAWTLIDQENKQRADNSLPELTAIEIKNLFEKEEENHPERFLQSREYSDGFGRQIQTRVLAAETQFGDAHFGNGVLPAKQSDESETKKTVTGRENIDPQQPNVIVNGWQTFNNKGKVVEQFEPFYHTGWEYLDRHEASADKTGVAAKMFYDPRGQVIRTLNPDGSEQRVLYGIPKKINNPEIFDPTPWQAYTYDANDNAGRTDSNGTQDYQNHWNTPAHIEIDPLGRTIKAVERLDNSDNNESQIITKSHYDILGNLLEVTDALNRVAFKYTYSLIPESPPLRIDSIDAGVRKIVTDAIGQEVERRDSKGALILQSYDTLQRPSHFWARDNKAGTVTLRQRNIYGDAGNRNEAKANNTLGQLTQHYDEAGKVSTTGFDFKGNPLDSTRQVIAHEHLLKPYENAANNNWEIQIFQVDWQEATGSTFEEHEKHLLNSQQYTTSSRFDALNRATEALYPQDVTGKRAKLTPTYNRSGALQSVALDGETYVERIAYNAKGQRILIAYGNGALTRYSYHPKTFRLQRLRTEHFDQTVHTANPLSYKPAGKVLQDFAYQYDLNGNILKIKDSSPESGISNLPQELERLFSYDPLSRLVSASGRECAKPLNTPDGPELPACNDLTRTRAYIQTYEYDKMGNMKKLRHAHGANQPLNTIRKFDVQQNNNQLIQVNFSRTKFAYTYDVNGNMTNEGSSRHFEWNHSDQMKAFRTQVGMSKPSVHAQYLYDATGMRVMKLVRKQNGAWESRVYIGEMFEHFRWDNTTANPKENNVLHVMDDQQRIALVRKGEAHKDDKGPAVQFHLGDHLGSSNLVLNVAGVLMNREEHYPYGETSFGSFSRKRYRFTGKERDEESGLNYHAARYYSVNFIKWVSPDPSGMIDNYNLFIYSKNNPIKYFDKTGKESTIPEADKKLTFVIFKDNTNLDAPYSLFGTTVGGNFQFEFGGGNEAIITLRTYINFERLGTTISAPQKSAFKRKLKDAFDSFDRTASVRLEDSKGNKKDIKLRFRLEVVKESDAHTTIDVHPRNTSSTALLKVAGQKNRAQVIYDVNVFLNISKVTLTHELAHKLGLPDEYEAPLYEKYFSPAHISFPLNEISSSEVDNIRNEGNKSLLKSGDEFKPRHFMHYLKAIRNAYENKGVTIKTSQVIIDQTRKTVVP